MISLDHARTMAAYNRWMNGRLYGCCATLADDVRRRDVGAFFKSIHGTLNHLLLADRVWLGRLTGKPFVVTSLNQELYTVFAELRAEREITDAAIDRWASGLSEADLAADVSYTTMVNPQPKRYPLWLAAVHLFNHQTHHRGQLTTLLSQCGIDPGVTDLLWLPELTTAAALAET